MTEISTGVDLLRCCCGTDLAFTERLHCFWLRDLKHHSSVRRSATVSSPSVTVSGSCVSEFDERRLVRVLVLHCRMGKELFPIQAFCFALL